MSKRNRKQREQEKNEQYQRLLNEVTSNENPFPGIPLEERTAFDQVMGAFAQTPQGQALEIDQRPINELMEAMEPLRGTTEAEIPLAEALQRLQLDDNGNLEMGEPRPDTIASQSTAVSRAEVEFAISSMPLDRGNLEMGEPRPATAASQSTAVSRAEVEFAISSMPLDRGNLEMGEPRPDTAASQSTAVSSVGEQAVEPLSTDTSRSVAQSPENQLQDLTEEQIKDLETLWNRGIIGPDTQLGDGKIAEALANLWREQGGPTERKLSAVAQSAAEIPSLESLQSLAQSPRDNSGVTDSVTSSQRANTAATRRRPNKKKKKGGRKKG
ncbi:hypothetical protein [Ascidiimonas sp. W6]|uniref:hypothetical protein n=1 Tax=Ascidiimonas meishanensis TaxID=3128903 RepID=UPI0030ED86F8